MDVVLDTDAYNEIDDQFAIAYLLKSSSQLTTRAIYAAPFLNDKAQSPKDGMEKSFLEIHKLLDLLMLPERKKDVYKGASAFLRSEKEAVQSAAAENLVQTAMQYTKENPLYVVGIAAITNIASAILMEPAIAEKIVVVWLGGSAFHRNGEEEFNMMQDVAAARVVFDSGVRLVLLPCHGVVEYFRISRLELEHWLLGRNALCDYLAENTIQYVESYAEQKNWTKTIWDVTAVGWLLNENECFMQERVVPRPIPEYDNTYSFDDTREPLIYITGINRDALFEDMIKKLQRSDKNDRETGSH